MKFETQKSCKSGERKVTISLEDDAYIHGHVIDGKSNSEIHSNQHLFHSFPFASRSLHSASYSVSGTGVGNPVNDHIRLNLFHGER